MRTNAGAVKRAATIAALALGALGISASSAAATAGINTTTALTANPNAGERQLDGAVDGHDQCRLGARRAPPAAR